MSKHGGSWNILESKQSVIIAGHRGHDLFSAVKVVDAKLSPWCLRVTFVT